VTGCIALTVPKVASMDLTCCPALDSLLGERRRTAPDGAQEVRMTRGRAVLAAAVIGFTLGACAGPGSDAADRPDTPDLDGTGLDLPEACVAEIREFLVAVEPMVSEMDFPDPSEEELDQLTPASDAFDPDVCPDLGVDEARAAWLAIAAESAPGAAPYVEYLYAD
jgi:hypothetical protein